MKKGYLLLILLSLAFQSQGQAGRGDIRQGNRYFKSEKYDNAEVAYRKALEEKKVNKVAEFNLGDALYRQKKFEEAGRQFEAAAANDVIKANSAKALHNLGNSMLQAGKIDESIEAYKNALRHNPTDLDTKYNLSYAKMMKKKKEESEKNDKKDQQQQADQQKPQDQKDQQQQQAKPQNVKISKEDAERLLEAVAMDEKKVQEKVKKDKANASKVRTIKDW